MSHAIPSIERLDADMQRLVPPQGAPRPEPDLAFDEVANRIHQERPDAPPVEGLPEEWGEDWAQTADTPVMRRDLVGLWTTVRGVSVVATRVNGQLGSLLEAAGAFRLVGWTLLVWAVFNTLLLLVGMEGMDAESEIKTLSALADAALAPLIGVAMAFWGGTFRRGVWELRLLKGVSWLCLVAALGYLGVIPLAVQDVKRLHQIQQQRAGQVEARLTAEFQQVRAALGRADDPRTLGALAGRILGRPIDIAPGGEMAAIRAEAAEGLGRMEQSRRQTAALRAARETNGLWLQGVKVVGESLLAGFLFLLLWRMTAWARRVDAGRMAQRSAVAAAAAAAVK